MSAPVVGIDLGTTNSLIAYMDMGVPRVISDAQGAPLLPSILSVDESGEILVGRSARDRLVTDPKNTVFSVKRLMGKGIEDVREEIDLFHFPITDDSREVIRLNLRGQVLTPPEVSAHILRKLKEAADKFFGEPVRQAVITVPAYFDDAQRQATHDAGKIAGLEVLRLVNEPTAASLAYGIEQRREGVVAVYDLGGGTFDISILKLREGIFEVISTNGDTRLGGDDIDARLIALVLTVLKQETGTDWSENDVLVRQIRFAVIETKHHLTDNDAGVIRFPLPEGPDGKKGRTTSVEIPVTRSQFEELVRPVVERTLPRARQALKDAGLEPEQIDEVVLVGGATRMPLVRRLVEDLFGRRPHTELNPDEVVALGAAVQADILAGGTADMLLLDVTPLSLGIENMGGVIAKIIHRNATIPASASEMFTTFMDGQTSVDIHVLQGERELVGDCRSLARFKLKVPPLPAGLARIEVKFLIDANGILNVTARDQRTGVEQSVEVKPSHGLRDQEVERMLLESFDHAEEDLNLRQLIEGRIEADIALRATEKALKEAAAAQLEPEERNQIERAVEELTAARAGNDHRLLRDRLEAFNETTHHFAEVLMEGAVKTVLKGKALKDV